MTEKKKIVIEVDAEIYDEVKNGVVEFIAEFHSEEAGRVEVK